MILLAELHLMSGDMPRYREFVDTISDPERARLQVFLPAIAYRLTRLGHKDVADLLLAEATAQEDQQAQDKYRRRIGKALAERHEFSKASEVGNSITDAVQLNWFLESLAKAQAEAGHWQEARTSADRIKVPPVEGADGWEEMLIEIRNFISRCEEMGIARKPEPFMDGSAASQYRAIAQAFSHQVEVDELDSAIIRAKSCYDPEKRSSSWRAIAQRQIELRESSLAGESLEYAVSAAKTIKDPYLRSLQLVLAADAYLENGDDSAAKRLVVAVVEDQGSPRSVDAGNHLLHHWTRDSWRLCPHR